jgi:hypothetical protein
MDLRNSTADTRSCSNLSAKPLIFGGRRTPQSGLHESTSCRLPVKRPSFIQFLRLLPQKRGSGGTIQVTA